MGKWKFNPRGDLLTYGTPNFLWVDGDANAPTIGPSLAATGAPLPGQTIPPHGLTAEVYDASSCRTTATALDPGLTDDIVVVAMIRTPTSGAVAYSAVASTRNNTRDWALILREDSNKVEFYAHGDSEVGIASGATASDGDTCVVFGIINRDGLMYTGINTTITAGGACPAGSYAGGHGIGIAAYPTGTNKMKSAGAIYWVSAWYGVGIADAWIAGSYARCAELSAAALAA